MTANLSASCNSQTSTVVVARARSHSIQRLSVVKYLSVPLLFVSALSEMSYCAHQKKLFLVPFPLLVGVAIAYVLNETALTISPPLKEDEVPWGIAGFFSLLTLAGTYYPYWGRIFIPHLANGALWYALSSALLWSRRSRNASGTGTTSNLNSGDGCQSDTDQLQFG